MLVYTHCLQGGYGGPVRTMTNVIVTVLVDGEAIRIPMVFTQHVRGLVCAKTYVWSNEWAWQSAIGFADLELLKGALRHHLQHIVAAHHIHVRLFPTQLLLGAPPRLDSNTFRPGNHNSGCPLPGLISDSLASFTVQLFWRNEVLRFLNECMCARVADVHV